MKAYNGNRGIVPFILRVLDCIVTISFGCLSCTVVVLTCFVMGSCVFVWVL